MTRFNDNKNKISFYYSRRCFIPKFLLEVGSQCCEIFVDELHIMGFIVLLLKNFQIGAHFTPITYNGWKISN